MSWPLSSCSTSRCGGGMRCWCGLLLYTAVYGIVPCCCTEQDQSAWLQASGMFFRPSSSPHQTLGMATCSTLFQHVQDMSLHTTKRKKVSLRIVVVFEWQMQTGRCSGISHPVYIRKHTAVCRTGCPLIGLIHPVCCLSHAHATGPCSCPVHSCDVQ